MGVFKSRKETRLISTNKNSIVVNDQKIQLKKGLNKIEYDLSVDSKTVEKLLKKDKKLKIKPAKNGKVYLPEGNYVISIENASTPFEISESK